MATCTHLDQIHDVTPSASGCEECLQMGDTWVELRLCLMCGHVGCCDNSKNRHASKHYHSSAHALVHPYGTFEEWLWCYVEEKLMFPY